MRKIIFILVISINIAYSQNNGGQLFFIEEPAVLSLKLPLQVGAEWTSKSDSNITILKEVIGRETLAINGNDYDCLKVKIRVIHSNNTEYIYYDWIAEEGLIKRTSFFTYNYTDSTGNIVGTSTSIEELILTDIDLK